MTISHSRLVAALKRPISLKHLLSKIREDENRLPEQYDAALDPALSFGNFVTGKSNHLALQAASRVSRELGVIHNPLYIFGKSDLGKTHLLHAIGNAVLARKPSAKLRYTSASEYRADALIACQSKNFSALRHAYHALDLLLIDDMQDLPDYSDEMKELTHNLEAMIKQNRQIVMAVKIYPWKSEAMDDLPLSSLPPGTVVAVGVQELEVKVGILMKKAQLMGVALPEDAAYFIAQNNPKNAWRLMNLFRIVIALSQTGGRLPPVLDIDLCQAALDKTQDPDEPLYHQAVKLALAEEHDVSANLLQDHLHISQNRAFGIITRMEEQGIVSKEEHRGRLRTVIGDQLAHPNSQPFEKSTKL